MPKINWYTDDVIVKVSEAADRALYSVAHEIEGQAKRNITTNGQVDTGFLRNSVYVAGRYRNLDNYQTALSAATTADGKRHSRRRGKQVKVSGRGSRRMAPKRSIPRGVSAIVVVGANYAVYQEIRKSFLYAAAEQVAASAGGTIEAEARKELNE